MNTSSKRKRAAALRAYRAGYPSLLPDSNPYRGAVQAHRWGRHYDGPRDGCPVCEERSRGT